MSNASGFYRKKWDLTTLDGFLRFISQNMEQHSDEINTRRLTWFFGAGLIKVATAKCKGNPELEDLVAEMWIKLIQGSAHLKALLERNIVWSEDEKVWFTHIKDERSGMEYTLNHVLPKAFRKHARIQSFAAENSLLVSLL